MSPELPDSFRRARRALEELQPQIVAEDWIWDDSITCWCLAFQANLKAGNKLPSKTTWVAVVEDSYPDGFVRIFPSVDGGIEDTYPHQSNNGLEPHGKYCRSGRLCLFTENTEWSIRGDADFTLFSHMEKFLEWLNAANDCKLLKDGDRVEFPMQNIGSGEVVLYAEDEVSQMIWESHPAYLSGWLEMLESSPGLVCLSCFYGNDNCTVYSPVWGAAFVRNKKKKTHKGIWLIASSVPHIRNWQSPNTYGELRIWARSEGIDLDEIVGQHSMDLRDGVRHYLAIGVACPDIVGGDARCLSWFVLKMPALSNGQEFGKSGVHKRDILKIVDKHKTFASNTRVDWVTSVNCSRDQLHSRGRLSEKLCESRIALIGVGSLGSLVANNLIRGGVTDLCVFDSDLFEIRNITRHLLAANNAGYAKASSVSDVLNGINPMAQVESRDALGRGDEKLFKCFDIIIDCSSSLETLSLLDKSKGNRRLFVCSFGYAAERVYISSSTLDAFSVDEYYRAFEPLMSKDIKLMNSKGLPWEGTGCWSPVFPAKNSDISRAASIITDCVDNFVSHNILDVKYAYEVKRDIDGLFEGIERIRL
ncbi:MULTISPECIES: ThiF family adenylyltransferase [Gordonibacter]|uniref:ThiF family adenylyltransferase n=1 Tax=Gordonibacter faecis TaxID=3047475 RepID=A0ABT7DKW3_9ACTN|nr:MULTISPECIES: ThiF family adenylyltransferase [unclassified Gordonibacter]MDJ1649892.1 ThiF family adenylyltransferase [Gordonibacter sp. KGMB12511]